MILLAILGILVCTSVVVALYLLGVYQNYNNSGDERDHALLGVFCFGSTAFWAMVFFFAILAERVGA